ncbi:uncharacterized protein LOC141656043 [Silene latifolia]|uniref:uncharacterized protein LOC141656043 n=1 Tax=Silene latifolia TaxID=37657 RepID=UPI003D77A504
MLHSPTATTITLTPFNTSRICTLAHHVTLANVVPLIIPIIAAFIQRSDHGCNCSQTHRRVYLSSPKSSVSAGSLFSVHETKACITHESSASKGSLNAFMLLKENPAAQLCFRLPRAPDYAQTKIWKHWQVVYLLERFLLETQMRHFINMLLTLCLKMVH